MIPARAPLTKQAQRTQVSPGQQVPLCGLAYEVGALGTQRGRSTASLADARTVDYSHARDSMQSLDAPSSMSERFVTDGHLRLSGRNDARCKGCHGIRRTRARRCHRHEGKSFAAVPAPDVRDHEHGSCWIAAIVHRGTDIQNRRKCAEVRGHGRALIKGIDSAANLITY
jgi:hypothetical protein